jgi:phage protein, HK97 gp10 family
MARLYGVAKSTGVGGGVLSNVRIVGVEQLIAKLNLVANVARLELGLLTKGAAEHMENAARENAPSVTGNLKSGIKTSRGAGPYNWEVTASTLDGTVAEKNQKEYAGYVEFGWSGHPEPEHFMTNAYAETMPIVYSDLQIIASKLMRL